MEVSSFHIVAFLSFLNLFLIGATLCFLKIKFDNLPNQEFNQVTQTQHILLGISQFLEAQFIEVKQKPADMIETAKSMIPLMIGKKLFPSFFDEMMPNFGGSPQQSSLTEPHLELNHGAQKSEEE